MTTRPDLTSVVRDYRARHRDVPVSELGYYAALPTDEAAITDAALSRVNGKKLSHQRRIPGAVLDRARVALLERLDDLRSAPSFDSLHTLVDEAIGHIHGIAELTVYDIALRIGARFSLEPERIYLHAGTRAGAKVLGLRWREDFLSLDELPAPLQALTAREAEDVLCIYKDYFRDGGDLSSHPTCGVAARAARGSRCRMHRGSAQVAA